MDIAWRGRIEQPRREGIRGRTLESTRRFPGTKKTIHDDYVENHSDQRTVRRRTRQASNTTRPAAMAYVPGSGTATT